MAIGYKAVKDPNLPWTYEWFAYLIITMRDINLNTQFIRYAQIKTFLYRHPPTSVYYHSPSISGELPTPPYLLDPLQLESREKRYLL